MERPARLVSWEAPEHYHIEKTADWYWILGILATAGFVACVIFENVLFGLVILLGSCVMMLYAYRGPKVIPFEISARGIRVDSDFFPYSTLESFFLDEEHPMGPQVIVKQKQLLSQYLIFPIPESYVQEIDALLSTRLPEEHLQEPISHQVLEFFGF